MYRLYHRSTCEAALKKLSIEKLYDWQEKVLPHILCFEDVFFSVPTSGGKSLMFQLPAVMDEGSALTIVVSPMLALQNDQVEELCNKGVSAAAINSSLSISERNDIFASLNTMNLLYVAPEQLMRQDLLSALARCVVSRVVIDEAHLLPEQKDGFRPAFARIGAFIDHFADRPQVIACTATATKVEQSIIVESLGLINPYIYHGTVFRPNLHLSVKHTDVREMIEIIVSNELTRWNNKGRALIFVPTIDFGKNLKQFLKCQGFSVLRYHAKMNAKQKATNMEKFRQGDCKIMIATSAFGLGVDIPNIRLVIHAGLPLGFSEYVQQIGRGGRNGKKTRCVLIYSNEDIRINQYILQNKRNTGNGNSMYHLLDVIKAEKCLWKSIGEFYGEKVKRCGHCDQCMRKNFRTHYKKQ